MLDNAEKFQVALLLPHGGVRGSRDSVFAYREAGFGVGIKTVSHHTMRIKICPSFSWRCFDEIWRRYRPRLYDRPRHIRNGDVNAEHPIALAEFVCGAIFGLYDLVTGSIADSHSAFLSHPSFGPRRDKLR